jgi:2'-hydroxyisoflavone reductase
MRLLIMGGTVFLGRHIVAAAGERGHELTLFNRGRSNPEPVPGVEQIHGDREHDLALLAGRRWDVVIDTSGYLPSAVRASAERLAGAIDRYVFVSSISAYGTFPRPGLREDAPLAPPPPPDAEDVVRYYSELKAASEGEVQSALPGRALVVRPGLIVGPYDPTERFNYWVRRLADGGRVLAPAASDQPVQLIDARDLANWIVRMAEAGAAGVYNATGPAAPLTFGQMLERIRSATTGAADATPTAADATATATRTAAEFVWVDEERLAEAGVEPWLGLPLWLDLPRNPDLRGFLAIDVSRALGAGLSFRPLEETVADTLSWTRDHDPAPPRPQSIPLSPPAGLSREREAELLARLAG